MEANTHICKAVVTGKRVAPPLQVRYHRPFHFLDERLEFYNTMTTYLSEVYLHRPVGQAFMSMQAGRGRGGRPAGESRR
jgi:hypothetical protein